MQIGNKYELIRCEIELSEVRVTAGSSTCGPISTLWSSFHISTECRDVYGRHSLQLLPTGQHDIDDILRSWG